MSFEIMPFLLLLVFESAIQIGEESRDRDTEKLQMNSRCCCSKKVLTRALHIHSEEFLTWS